jgi:hypothetical protein
MGDVKMHKKEVSKMFELGFPNIVSKKLWGRIPSYVKVTFFAAVAVGLLTHAFMLTNKLPNYDDVNQFFDTLHRERSGRWLLWLPAAFSTSFSMPWVNGILGILYLAASACFIAAIAEIKTSLYCILLAALMETFPVVCSIFPFMNCADPYFFAFVLSCLATYLTVRYRFGFLAGIILLTCSLGIYQAFFPVAAGLFVMALIFDLLKLKKGALLRGVKYAATLAVACMAYLIVTKLVAGDQLVAYQGISEMGQIHLADLPILIVRAYRGVRDYYWNSRDLLFGGNEVFFLLLTVLSVGLLVWLIVHKKIYRSAQNFAFLCLLIAIFPLAFNFIYVMQGIDFLPKFRSTYGMILMPVSCLALLQFTQDVVIEEKNQRKLGNRVILPAISWMVALSLALCTSLYWLRTNQAYLKLYLFYEQGFAYSNTLLTRIQSVKGYTPDTEVVFVGVPQVEPSIPDLNDLGRMEKEMMGHMPQVYTYGKFLRYYLGNTQESLFLSYGEQVGKQLNEMGLIEIVQGMPFYPADGSIILVGDRIVVRF